MESNNLTNRIRKPTLEERYTLIHRKPNTTGICPMCEEPFQMIGSFGICDTPGCKRYLEWAWVQLKEKKNKSKDKKIMNKIKKTIALAALLLIAPNAYAANFIPLEIEFCYYADTMEEITGPECTDEDMLYICEEEECDGDFSLEEYEEDTDGDFVIFSEDEDGTCYDEWDNVVDKSNCNL